MVGKTIDEKRAYHRKYYQDNIDRLQDLSRKRYWSLKNGAIKGASKKARRTNQIKIEIVKQDVILYFD